MEQVHVPNNEPTINHNNKVLMLIYGSTTAPRDLITQPVCVKDRLILAFTQSQDSLQATLMTSLNLEPEPELIYIVVAIEEITTSQVVIMSGYEWAHVNQETECVSEVVFQWGSTKSTAKLSSL